MTVGFGLIGYGLWGQHHAQAIREAPGARLAAIACGTEAGAARARLDWPEVPVSVGHQALLARTDVDAVAVVVPNHLHAEIGVAALEAGKDVLLEKPMAVTPEECDRLLAAARRSGRVLTIGHELRLSAQWGRIKQMVDAGEIGDLLYVSIALFRFPYRPGSGGWRYAAAQVGSWIHEEPVHAFDFALWYLEAAGDPVSILAVGNSKGRGPGLYDNVSALLRFPGGRYALITQTLGGFEYHSTTEVVGTEGALRAWWSGTLDRTLHPAFDLRVQRRGAAAPEVVPVARSGEVFELRDELAQVVAAFRERRPLVSGEEARKRVVLCCAAERSIREGRELPLAFG